jgi:O-antigen/teichoic acid export membrane protein
MGQMNAVMERLIPRLTSACVLLATAHFTSPHDIGVYAWGVMFYTFFQAVSEGPARHVLLEALQSQSGRNFLATFRIASALTGSISITTAIGLLVVLGPNIDVRSGAQLLPFALAPIATAAALPAVGRLQLGGDWGFLARSQMLASSASLLVAVPILLVTRSIFAASLQTLVAEASLCWIVWRRVSRAEKRDSPTSDRSATAAPLWSTFGSMATFTGLSWFQGQSDRLVLGIVAGAAILGSYAFATSIARAVGDSLAAATANLLRVEISSLLGPERTDEAIRMSADRVCRRAVLFAILTAAMVVLGTYTVLDPLLSAKWDSALEAVPALTVATFFTALAWSGSVLQLYAGKPRRATWSPIISATFALPIAFLAQESLIAAAVLVIIREFTAIAIGFSTVRHVAPWKAFALASVSAAIALPLVTIPFV